MRTPGERCGLAWVCLGDAGTYVLPAKRGRLGQIAEHTWAVPSGPPASNIGCRTIQEVERERALLFGREAERYDRSRPTYPSALIEEVMGSSPHSLSVLDVGCGTGIASRLVAERGARVLGVELNAGMAEVADRRGIPTEVAAFETYTPPGAPSILSYLRRRGTGWTLQ